MRRYVYLVAFAMPGLSLAHWLLAPYPLYRVEEWAWFALAPLCLIQFLLPTVAGWVLVSAAYAWSIYLQVQEHIGAFQDFGSEDHSRWAGWSVELLSAGFTVWFIGVVVLLAIHRPRRVAHAT